MISRNNGFLPLFIYFYKDNSDGFMKKIGDEENTIIPIFFYSLKPNFNFTGICIKFQFSSSSIFNILSDSRSI
jgi:hypothetical protein